MAALRGLVIEPLRDKVVVVTGASSGVGRATVRELARRGARLGLVARGADGLDGARADVEAAGSRALTVPTDIADATQVEAAAELIERELGAIDVWVNDAMTSIFAPFWQIEPEEYRRTTEVTYLGAVYGTMAAVRRMRARNAGTIVQVGSALAYRGIPLQSAYCGAKHAMQGFTESLRCELLHEKSSVKITMVQLPAINTPQFDVVRSRLPRKAQPVPPIYQPEVAARAIAWAAEGHDRREVWVGGSTAITITGNKFAAGLGDHYLGRTGFDSQQTKEPTDPGRPDNLFEPVPGDRGAHGRFDDRARGRSPQLFVAMRRRALLAATGLLGVAVGSALGRRRQ
jgi:NAD(P)-dependent dehydrogenase (short-subunit alcohol dehydrogenase family)